MRPDFTPENQPGILWANAPGFTADAPAPTPEYPYPPPIALAEIDRLRAEGWHFLANDTGWTAINPAGEHGHGPSVEAAIAWIGAVRLPNPETQVLETVLRDGTVIPIVAGR